MTNDNTLIFSGTAEPNGEVTLSEAVLGVIGSATADASGVWSVDAFGTLLPDGNYSLTATAEDVAGNLSGLCNAFLVEVDTVAPNAPAIAGIAEDTGSSASDGVTKDNTLIFTGSSLACNVSEPQCLGARRVKSHLLVQSRCR